jgi:hypothetical protein
MPMLEKVEVLVLRDRLGRHLVGLNMRRGTALRVLGLACLTRGLVRWTRHRWSWRRGSCQWSGSRSAGRWLREDEQRRIRWEPETRSGVEDSRRRCALVIGPKVMWEREIGNSEFRRMCPQPLSTFCIRAARQGPTTINWLAPPIRARDQTGLRLSLMPLDARWSQFNNERSDPHLTVWSIGNERISHKFIDKTCLGQGIFLFQLHQNGEAYFSRLSNLFAT